MTMEQALLTGAQVSALPYDWDARFAEPAVQRIVNAATRKFSVGQMSVRALGVVVQDETLTVPEPHYDEAVRRLLLSGVLNLSLP